MARSRDESPGYDYFNDLSQQAPEQAGQTEERRDSQEEGGQFPKPKRIACVLCRKRKLKCDGSKPSCGTCTRMAHDCSYDEVRRKSGPKRGYVKALEARLAQVETMLKTKDDQPTNGGANEAARANYAMGSRQQDLGMISEFNDILVGASNANMLSQLEGTSGQQGGDGPISYPDTVLNPLGNDNLTMSPDDQFSWEMIGLGLDEPLPNQDAVDELNQAFFDKIHPSVPMIHRPRYYAAMSLAPHVRPPICLRYAMWCNAAVVMDKYESLHEHFYQRARKYIQQDEMRGHGESMITVVHAQAWVLLGTYEFKMMYFPRAWMSVGRASRLALMMGLHRMDSTGLDVKQCLPTPKDWTEREERRRTFWMTFCVDRYSSIGTGWPMTIDEKDIVTSLPVPEEDFELNRSQKTKSLEEALSPNGASNLSSYAVVILMACLFGRNLIHLHRPGQDDSDEDLNGEFWKRHRGMDNILLNTALTLPDPLRLPAGLNDPNIVFLNMNIHTSTICLHQAAIYKAEKNRMPTRVSAESKVRCITAAAEIASIMRTISHLDLSPMNPFISFSLYVAARVFVQYLKSRPKDGQVRTSLQFLLSAMHAIKRKNPLTESFLVQLDVDLEGAGLEDWQSLRAYGPMRQSQVPNRSPACPSEHLGTSATSIPAYSDMSLAAYNDPNHSDIIGGYPGTQKNAGAQGTYKQPNAANANKFVLLGTCNHFNLASRSPAALQHNTQTQGRTQSANPEMDTSPDGSRDQQTPGSSTQSQHNSSSLASNTANSPQNQLHDAKINNQSNNSVDPTALLDLNDNAFTDFAPDFAMHSFTTSRAEQQQQQGVVLPQNWSSGGTGFTPGPGDGLSPYPDMGDMMGMSETDWNQVLADFNTWNSGQGDLPHDQSMQDNLQQARKS